MKKLAKGFWTTSVAMDAGRLVWLPTIDTSLLTGPDLPITRGGVKDAVPRSVRRSSHLSRAATHHTKRRFRRSGGRSAG